MNLANQSDSRKVLNSYRDFLAAIGRGQSASFTYFDDPLFHPEKPPAHVGIFTPSSILKTPENQQRDFELDFIEQSIDRLQLQLSMLAMRHEKIAGLQEIHPNPSSPPECRFSLSLREDSPVRGKTLLLTPHNLAFRVIPYLECLCAIQAVINDIRGTKNTGIRIRRIEQNSPLNIEIDGVAEALKVVREDIVPWRRRHQKAMAQLQEVSKQVEIENSKAELLEIRARAMKSRREAQKITGEALKTYQEAAKLKLENEKMGLELQKAKFDLAIQTLEKVSPHVPEKERLHYVLQLVPLIDHLVVTDLEICAQEQVGIPA